MEDNIIMKIHLSKDEKLILLGLNSDKYSISENDKQWLLVLEQKKLIGTNKGANGRIRRAYITDFGKAYLSENPKLNNPSIWDDKKYIITTIISGAAILISAVALYISITKN